MNKIDLIGLAQGYLGTMVLFIDGINGFPITNSFFGALRYVSHLGGLI